MKLTHSRRKPYLPTVTRHAKLARSAYDKRTARRRRSILRLMAAPIAVLVLIVVIGVVCIDFIVDEARTSEIQAQYAVKFASDAKFSIQVGAAHDFWTPTEGPYNHRLGYSYLPFFIKTLVSEGYEISNQARTNDGWKYLVARGIYPIYDPKTTAGIQLTDELGEKLYTASYPANVYTRFEDIPSLVVKTLAFIENRAIVNDDLPITHNPVVEWHRFLSAVFVQAFRFIVPAAKGGGGGSTLATQLEKFRFSPGGRTGSAKDKIIQILSATLRVYQHGSDTRKARKQIILDYLNSTPLSARAGFGEINSIGDGLKVWFGRDFEEANAALALSEDDTEALHLKSSVYREILALIIAQRRPSAYLGQEVAALEEIINTTIDILKDFRVISQKLADATKALRLKFAEQAPMPEVQPLLDNKANNALRNNMMRITGLKNPYDLDRLDVQAVSSMNSKAQKAVSEFLKNMGNPEFVHAQGLYGFRLLQENNDPANISWSVLLYEKRADGNFLRVQADNINAPLDMNDGAKLDLGSTAKLRTLITYLEIMSELWRRHAGLSADELAELREEAPDNLTLWTTTWLIANPHQALKPFLEAAMERKYSASPYETFFTGGGAHTFVNFEKREDGRVMDLHEALRDSVNLVFIRLMRDIVNYTISQGEQTKQEILGDADNPARKVFLQRFAEKEGGVYLSRFMRDYAKLNGAAAIERLAAQSRHKGAVARAVLFRSVRPKASYQEFSAWMLRYALPNFDQNRLPKLFRDYAVEKFNLNDRAYIAGINPLELWLVAWKNANPDASAAATMAASRSVRLESYSWLFRARRKGAQDSRIRTLLEEDAFARIHARWQRMGYPFDRLVPSYATAIGSSADRPGALAELAGIILNDGMRMPLRRFTKITFASSTPYETTLVPTNQGLGAGKQVLDAEVARVVRVAMAEVINNGTAQRLKGAYHDSQGAELVIGAKTGTGDHRYDEFGAGGRLISSRVVNRTGTIVFYIGDRFFGTVTAHVAGEKAQDYKFTSALSAQMVKSLRPALAELIEK